MKTLKGEKEMDEHTENPEDLYIYLQFSSKWQNSEASDYLRTHPCLPPVEEFS